MPKTSDDWIVGSNQDLDHLIDACVYPATAQMNFATGRWL